MYCTVDIPKTFFSSDKVRKYTYSICFLITGLSHAEACGMLEDVWNEFRADAGTAAEDRYCNGRQ